MARGQHGQCGQLCLHSHRPSLTSPLHLYTLMKNEDYIHTIERFFILFYDRTRTSTEVDKARCKLFAKNSNVQLISPTSAALKQHVRQAVHQGGHVFGQAVASAPSSDVTRRLVRLSALVRRGEHCSYAGSVFHTDFVTVDFLPSVCSSSTLDYQQASSQARLLDQPHTLSLPLA